jgi:hypothetical protein
MPDPKTKAAKAAPKPPKETPKETPAAPKPAEGSNDAAPKEKHTKPEKPDDDAYKVALAAAEKDLDAAKARLVRQPSPLNKILMAAGQSKGQPGCHSVKQGLAPRTEACRSPYRTKRHPEEAPDLQGRTPERLRWHQASGRQVKGGHRRE